jgi:hypothetical protein
MILEKKMEEKKREQKYSLETHPFSWLAVAVSVIRRLRNSWHSLRKNPSQEIWVYIKLGKGNTKGSMVGPRWNLEVERACFSSPGTCKTYANLWEGKSQCWGNILTD